jgi:shikimate kinase
MRIFLIGFMGSGKTTFGKKLASSLAWPFYDLDHQVETLVQQSIPEYFATYGEEAFRLLEKKTLQSFEYPESCVISCGGGTPCFFDNMDWMNAQGLTIYLDLPPLALAQRLEKGKHKRPLLKDLDEAGLIAFIESKLAERIPYYEKARMSIRGLDINAENVKNKILQGSYDSED